MVVEGMLLRDCVYGTREAVGCGCGEVLVERVKKWWRV